MGNLVTDEANAILESSVAGVAYTAPTTPILLALMTAMGADASTAGTEVTNPDGTTSYAQQAITFTGGASSGSITNNAAVNFTNMPAVASPGIVGIELWDSAAPSVRRWFGTLAADKVINKGDTVTFNASSVTIGLS